MRQRDDPEAYRDRARQAPVSDQMLQKKVDRHDLGSVENARKLIQHVWHTGGAMGGNGVVLFYPDRELVVATLADASDVLHSDLAENMATILLGDEQADGPV